MPTAQKMLFTVTAPTEEEIRRRVDPKKWAEWRSAHQLYYRWTRATGLPAKVSEVLAKAPEYARAEILHGFFEHQTALDDYRGPSVTDLLLFMRIPDGLAVAAIEGKVDEAFDLSVADKRRQIAANPERRERSNWSRRLDLLCNGLGLDHAKVDPIAYQLIHRTAAAVIEARRYGASHALMLVHSFAIDNPKFSEKLGDRFGDYSSFAELLGFRTAIKDSVTESKKIGGISLRLGWIADRARKETPKLQPGPSIRSASGERKQ